MSDRSKVVWSEGLFLRPQHLQQQERYLEWFVEGRTGGLTPFSWGFHELEIDRDLLTIGKLAIRRARGVLPDGTPFAIPDHDPPPPPLEVQADVRNHRAYLALPLRRSGSLEADRRPGMESLARQAIRELELRDVTVESPTAALIEIGGLRTRILLEGSPREDFACVPLAHILECRPDRQVVLDESFMPTVLSTRACAPLDRFLKELCGLVHQRGEALTKIVTGGAHGGLSGLRDFMRFQVMNRYEPLLQHCTELQSLHPQDFYRSLLVMAGDLSGLCQQVQRPPLFPTYDHGDLRASFEPLIAALRRYIIDESVSPVVSIDVELMQSNVYLARINDSTLLDSGVFILAVKASMPADEIRRRVPQMVTVAPAVRLKQLVEAMSSGLELSPLAQIPPLIPFFAGYVYFEIGRNNALWKEMKGSGAFGLFVGEALTNLSFLMWAVRGG
jgi:type VI secretion system protein ImpJ